MPRKAKEKIDEIIENTIKTDTSNKKTTKKTSTRKSTTAKSDKVEKKSSTTKKTTSKKSTTKEETNKNSSGNKSISKKISTNKVVGTGEAKLKETPSKEIKKETQTRKTSKTKKETKTPKVEIVEYYDLPYRYNQTVVKILAQTPSTLFVYWDISDENKEQYIKQYGDYFFNNTKPVLIVHNKTLNYSFEVDINDFANSWYLHVQDSNCNYQIELGRRPINNYVQISNNYLHITTSNDAVTQNDHILFDKLSHMIYFRNVKTNQTIVKNIANFALLQKIGKFDINFIKELYKKLYPNEVLDFDKLDLRNPSSNPTSTFK